MIKLNRTTEYGLIALRHMSGTQSVTSAREIADRYGLPFEITAKTLQRLKDTGLIFSAQGARGGYTLGKSLDQVTLAEFLVLMEGPQSVVACSSVPESLAPEAAVSGKRKQASPCDCEYQKRCEIQGVMDDLNRKVYGFLAGIRLADLTNAPPKESVSWQSFGV